MADVKNTQEPNTTDPKETNTQGEPKGANENNTPAENWEEREKKLREEMQKETERRVTEAVKTANAKWKKEAEREKLSEEEKRRLEEQEKAAENARKEHELIIKGLRLDVVDAISELGMSSGFRNLVAVDDIALIPDEDERKAKVTERIKGLKKLFDAEVKKQVEKEKSEFLKGHTPPASKDKEQDGDEYSQAKKAGNVRGMIGAKLTAYHSEE